MPPSVPSRLTAALLFCIVQEKEQVL
jgi:hypothetical protein